MSTRPAKSKLLSLISLCILATLFSLNATAQSGKTGVSGTVTDQAGAAVPGATVTLINPEIGFTRTITVGDDGKYSFQGIPPATYRLEATAQNFKKLVNSNVRALVDTPIEVNLALQPGDVSAVVDITADS